MHKQPEYFHLKEYLKQQGRKGVPYNEKTAEAVIEMMDYDMSPDIRTCDGEISRKEVRLKIDKVIRAKADLEHILGRKIELENY